MLKFFNFFDTVGKQIIINIIIEWRQIKYTYFSPPKKEHLWNRWKDLMD